jgi:multiple sugar transport system substrate-binding protein
MVSTRRAIKRLVGGLSVILLATTAAACGGDDGGDSGSIDGVGPADFADPTEPITITYAGAAYDANQVQPVLDAFHEAHPNITVKYESVPFEDFNSVLAARLTNASDSIDVFDTDMPRTDAYVARGWLADLSATFPGLADSVDPGSLEAATVDGKLYAMPYQTSTNLLYYNKTLLAKAGLEFPSADPNDRLTWEDVRTQAEQAQTAGAQYGIVFDQIDRYYQLEPLAISAGGGPGASGEGNLTPDVANDGWIKAFSWYGGLFADGLSPRGVAVGDTPNMFAAGQVAFYPGGPWWGAQFTGEADLDFGVAPFPAFEGGEAATPTGGWSLGLNPKASTEKADAVAVFRKFWGLDGGGYAQYLEGQTVLPANLDGASTYYDAELFTDPRFAGVTDLIKYEVANTATLRLQTVGYVEFEDVMTKAFDDVINGSTPAAVLEGATGELDDAWAQYRG